MAAPPALVLPLGGSRLRSDVVGGKAARLSELLEAGFPVPAGFVLCTGALNHLVRSVGLLPACEEAARTEAAGDGRRALEAGERVAAVLRSVELPPDLFDVLAGAHRDLLASPLLRGVPSRPPSLLVVRSSASGEDGTIRSHAGQYDSVLNLRGLEGLIDGVRQVWASWYSERAIDYRLRLRGASVPGSRVDLVGEATIPPMAVLVQRLVPARSSGMLFTANPVTGSREEMSVEAGPGLGEVLAQGRVHPDFFSVRRQPDGKLKLRHKAIGAKAHQTLPRPPGSGELELSEVPERLRGRPCIRRRELMKLCRMGLEVEELLGQPVDIEWCVDSKRRLFLLQARPVTALRTRRRSLSRPLRERPVLWTQRFAGERWTGQATPLGWSVIQPVLHHFIEWKAASERWLDDSAPTRLYRGRPYFNVTIFRHLAFRLPGMSPPQFLLEMFPADEQDELLHEAPYLPNPGLVGSILKELVVERRWQRYRFNLLTNYSDWETFRPRFEQASAELPLDFPDAASGLRCLDDARSLMLDYMSIHLLSLLFAHLGYEVLDKALRGWVGLEGEAIRSALVAEPANNETLRANAALWQLAGKLRETPQLGDAIEQGADPLEGDLDGEPGGAELREAFEAFLADYGHRSSASYEIFATRWSDSPELVLQMLQACLRSSPDQHPARSAARRELDRGRAERLVARRMGRSWTRRLVPWRQRLFGRLLELTRSYMALRENQRFAFDRLLLRMKRMFERIGALLERDGLLERGEDVVFLEIDELHALVGGALDRVEASSRIEARRAEFEANASTLHPDFLEGEEHVEGAAPEALGEHLQGLGISPGQVTGRVRVLAGLHEVDKLQPGDILVARGVDPGWTPLFLTLGGLILELGSVLSHGAVVAREYELPAVVNVERATRILEDGMEVTVDGDRGRVVVHRAGIGPQRKEQNVLDGEADA